tara:strand:- start:195 stop:716 length:522 start_codon:yes stop_codon:yes gene_type:complete
MAGSLEFINQTVTGSDVASVNVDNVFSDKYDVYFFTINNILSADTSEDVLGIRLINSSGSVSSSNYLRSLLILRMYDTFTQANSVKTYINTINLGGNSTSGGALSGYFFNPYDSSSYTFNTFQSSNNRTSGYNVGRKGINVHSVAQSERGFQIINSESNNFESGLTITTYGVK